MLSTLRSNLTYANVMATVAVFIALGGSSYAAIKVTGRDVKNSSLTGRDIKNSSLRSADVANGGLLAADFKAGQLPAGGQGPKGDQGPPGEKGDPGAAGNDGADGTSVTSAAEPAGANCADGGAQFTATNGVTYACNGAKGDPATKLWAVVNPNGTLARGSTGTSSSHIPGGDGIYEVVFDRDVRECAYVGGLGGSSFGVPPAGSVGITNSAGQGAPAVFVTTYDASGAATDVGFHMAVFC